MVEGFSKPGVCPSQEPVKERLLQVPQSIDVLETVIMRLQNAADQLNQRLIDVSRDDQPCKDSSVSVSEGKTTKLVNLADRISNCSNAIQGVVLALGDLESRLEL